jgi:ABC-2 type transport system ATP-binding protein
MDIRTSGLGKTYDGRTWAVADVGLHIPSGAVFGLIGPNGAGKSTTLRMLAGVMAPSHGEITWGTWGTARAAGEGPPLHELRRRIGFLGDGNPLYKHMSPAEYLRFFGQCFGMRGAALEAAIADTLVLLRLEAKRDAPAGTLSKGMRQRLLIARCLLHAPELLILDEPADGLDPRGRSELRKVLHAVRDRGVTIVISSHILRELDDLCDQVAILEGGRIKVAGAVGDIVEGHEVSHFSYELRVLPPVGAAADLDPPPPARIREVLSPLAILVEHEGRDGAAYTARLQIRGDEGLMADALARLVGSGVRVVACARVRTRLEDVYERLSDDRVN